jgi:hypothetical protein
MLTLFFVVLGIVLFGSIIFYAESGEYDAENRVWLRPNVVGSEMEESPFTSIPAAFWFWYVVVVCCRCLWFNARVCRSIVSATTVGFGDLVPTSIVGKIFGSVVMLSGIIVLALPISIIGANFTTAFREYEGFQGFLDLGYSRDEAARLIKAGHMPEDVMAAEQLYQLQDEDWGQQDRPLPMQKWEDGSSSAVSASPVLEPVNPTDGRPRPAPIRTDSWIGEAKQVDEGAPPPKPGPLAQPQGRTPPPPPSTPSPRAVLLRRASLGEATDGSSPLTRSATERHLLPPREKLQSADPELVERLASQQKQLDQLLAMVKKLTTSVNLLAAEKHRALDTLRRFSLKKKPRRNSTGQVDRPTLDVASSASDDDVADSEN